MRAHADHPVTSCRPRSLETVVYWPKPVDITSTPTHDCDHQFQSSTLPLPISIADTASFMKEPIADISSCGVIRDLRAVMRDITDSEIDDNILSNLSITDTLVSEDDWAESNSVDFFHLDL
mmetsp:Transcript_23513/g.23720  ORF Transcript_23513/g.23720 Transcript_23513/m.23720 type:complete len:121 (-) Transcript_23513:91-453(-)